MNIIKINIAIIICFSYSCKNSENKSFSLEDKLKREWILDSLGCNGKRNYIVEQNLEKIKLLKDENYDLFYKIFGKSNDVKMNKYGNEVFLYWVGCSQTPRPKISSNDSFKTRTNYESKRLLIEVNKDNMIVSIKIMMP